MSSQRANSFPLSVVIVFTAAFGKLDIASITTFFTVSASLFGHFYAM